VLRRLEADIFPVLGSRPIADVTAPQLLAMAKRVESRGALDMAKRSLQTCGQIMRFAVAHGVIERNPSADVKPSDALKPRRKESYARLDAREVPELLRKIEAYQGSSYTRLAMKLMAYTFVRTCELIAARMKMRMPHIVPLARQAIEVVQALQTLSTGRSLLFPGERDQVAAAYNHATHLEDATGDDEGLGCAPGQTAQRCRCDCLESACSLSSGRVEPAAPDAPAGSRSGSPQDGTSC
jgi:integrase